MRRLRSLIDYARLIGSWQTIRLAAAYVTGRRQVELSVGALGTSIRCRPRRSDRHVLASVLLEHHDRDRLIHPRFIIDAGANIGITTALFAHRYPEALVFAVEPSSSNYELLRHNCRRFPNVRLYCGAIWNRSTSLAIQNPEGEPWAFRVAEVAAGTPRSIRGYTISELLGESGHACIDLLKLDIEGAEARLFAGDTSWLDAVRVMIIEVHSREAEATIAAAVDASKCRFLVSRTGEKLVYTNLEARPAQ